MTDREIMQQALEALEETSGGYSQNLIAALRERLAQPEPVIDKSAATRIATALGWVPPSDTSQERKRWHKAGARAIRMAINIEREACAKVCDELAARDKLSNYYAVAAKAIRARGQG